MLTRTIEFEDIDGKKVVEEFHFHVSRTDMIDLLIEKPEMEAKLTTMAESMDGRSIIGLLKEFIFLSVGKRPANGRQFIKNQEITDDFRYSGAYDSLLWELTNNPEMANEFLEGIFPASLLEEIKKSGSLEDLRKRVAEGKSDETVVALPDKDWAAKPVSDHPLRTNENFETNAVMSPSIAPSLENVKNPQTFVEGEVVTESKPTPFPESLPEAIAAQRSVQETGESERPAWLKEMREPTGKELLEMPKSEMALAFRLKEEGKLNTEDKRSAG
jgi:hypothetical protein